jgi:hypothetical protein
MYGIRDRALPRQRLFETKIIKHDMIHNLTT